MDWWFKPFKTRASIWANRENMKHVATGIQLGRIDCDVHAYGCSSKAS